MKGSKLKEDMVVTAIGPQDVPIPPTKSRLSIFALPGELMAVADMGHTAVHFSVRLGGAITSDTERILRPELEL